MQLVGAEAWEGEELWRLASRCSSSSEAGDEANLIESAARLMWKRLHLEGAFVGEDATIEVAFVMWWCIGGLPLSQDLQRYVLLAGQVFVPPLHSRLQATVTVNPLLSI